VRLNAEGLRRLERGDLLGSDELFRAALREAELVDDLPSQAESQANLAASAAARGDSASARQHSDAADALYQSLGVPSAGRVRAWTSRGSLLLAASDIAGARGSFELALRDAEALSEPELGELARIGLAAIALREGRSDEALSAARASVERSRSVRDGAALGAALRVEAAVWEARGALGAAQDRLEEALAVDRERADPIGVREQLGALADVAARRGAPGAAAGYWVRRARVSRGLQLFDEADAELARAEALVRGDDRTAREVSVERGLLTEARLRAGAPVPQAEPASPPAASSAAHGGPDATR
jgi:tetratricopeptide (TPR) repeat protein